MSFCKDKVTHISSYGWCMSWAYPCLVYQGYSLQTAECILKEISKPYSAHQTKIYLQWNKSAIFHFYNSSQHNRWRNPPRSAGCFHCILSNRWIPSLRGVYMYVWRQIPGQEITGGVRHQLLKDPPQCAYRPIFAIVQTCNTLNIKKEAVVKPSLCFGTPKHVDFQQ